MKMYEMESSTSAANSKAKEIYEKAKEILKSILGDGCPSFAREDWYVWPIQKQGASGKWGLIEKDDDNPTCSDALFESFIPTIASVEACHFTDFEAFSNIVESGQIWLTQLTKQLSHDEIKEFAKTHEMALFEDEKQIEDLANDLFYISLTHKENLGPNMWGAHGEIRLSLDIKPTDPDCELRRIIYLNQKSKTLLVKVNQMMLDAHIWFTPRKISRLCAFGLPSTGYEDEQETRLLVKRKLLKDKVSPSRPELFLTNENGKYDVCPVHLLGPNDTEVSELCHIRLLAIDVQDTGTKNAVKAAIASTKYHSIPVNVI